MIPTNQAVMNRSILGYRYRCLYISTARAWLTDIFVEPGEVKVESNGRLRSA